MLLTVSADSWYSDQGSVVLVDGVDSDGKTRRFAGDSRMVYDILNAATVEGEVAVEVEGWQLWGNAR